MPCIPLRPQALLALLGLLASSFVLWLAAPPAMATFDQDKAVDPKAIVPDPQGPTAPSGTAPDPSTTTTGPTTTGPTTTGPTTTGPTTTGPQPPQSSTGEAIRRDPGYGSAALQSRAAKRREANGDCVSSRPPVSRMLALGGSVAGDEEPSWGWLVVLIVAAAVLLAGTMFVIRRRRAKAEGKAPESRGPLETTATLVAIVGGIAALAAQFIPGVGVDEDPPPEASMAVRQVHSRITRGEYATQTGSTVRLSRDDRREVGNVIWLEIELKGYRDRRPALQYGLYDRGPAADGALLPQTAKEVGLLVENKDAQTSLVPIWVGYPKSAQFEVQFRLLEGRRVRRMARTGKMRGSSYRYACSARS